MSIEAMKQAVEAFEHIKKYVTDDGAMPENWDAYHEKEYFALEALRQAIVEAEKQEPVVEVQYFGEKQIFVVLKQLSDGDKLYTAPPRKDWVGLTDEDKELLVLLWAPPIHPDFNDDDFDDLLKNVEAKLKEKNNG